ncbi:MAG TPA: NACHT domain-containing protein [Trebonia sp.]|nr:NACHT domain-containing protein [Trebonia sp.]
MSEMWWRHVVQASAVPGYGHRYRRWVLDSLRYIDVQDLATGGDHIPELGDVYVDVALVSRASQQSPGDRPAADDASARHTIDELLDRRSRVVLGLIGQPGSGKSTLLAHAARRSGGTTLWSHLGGGRPGQRRVPVLLALRERAESIVANPAISLPDVIRAAVGGAPGREPGGWWERQLERGRCLILLDGLDEVARADDRLAVAAWIERQIAAHPGNHVVVTSRSYDFLGPLAVQADVLVARPFTAKQVQLFLDRWYLAAERHATGASGRTAGRAVQLRARESAERLNSLLQANSALRDLAVNPLLLTMIATAHRYRGALPGSRADLYGEICQVLLSRRAQAKDLPELLSWPAKQMLLASLAYQMMRDHASDLPAARVLEILGPQLERYSSSVTGDAFLDSVARNGLLVEAEGRYAFTHLTFQEYLAARHVSANSDLVKSLVDRVSDPWWHETILLYAATADASPIVRGCLDSGTIAALTLAFDCAEASTEIDPDLRRRLDAERQRAYEPDCSPAHRRLIAGVQVARLVRQTLTTDAGTRICARPVPADLYWLFLADTAAPGPDRPCAPDAEQPAVGIWGTEAQAFVAWANAITATATGLEVRLPTRDELQEEGIAAVLARQLPASVTSTWTQPELRLWVRPGQPHPHEVTGAAISAAIAADARNTAMLPQILTATILDVAFSIIRDLDDIRALSGALARDLATRARSEGRAVELMHAHAHAIVLTYAHALELTRAGAITTTVATAPGLITALNLTRPRALADALAGELTGALELARVRAVELAAAVDEDLSILGAFDFDVAHPHELALVHVADLDRADVLARAIAHDPDPELARVLGLERVDALGPALPLPGILGLPLRWIADGPLASTLLQVLAAHSPAAVTPDPYQAFALALSSRAGIGEATRLQAALGTPLTDALRTLTVAESGRDDRGSNWSRVTGLGHLTDACGPMDAAHQPPSPAQAAALRAVAVALANGTDADGVLRTAAATVTLVESRDKGESAAGESIILAVELCPVLCHYVRHG